MATEWYVYEENGKPKPIDHLIKGLDVYEVAQRPGQRWIALTQEPAHAILLAAAPKMLKALKAARRASMSSNPQDWSDAVDGMDAAIAAAEGREVER